MKILHVINDLGPAGAQGLLSNYLLADDSGLRHDLCLLYPTDPARTACFEGRPIRIYRLDLARKYSLAAVVRLGRLIRCNRYDLVHVHLFPAQYFAALVAPFFPGTRFVFSEHNAYNRRRDHRLCRYSDRLSYLPYQKIVCVSADTRKHLLDWLPGLAPKAVTVYNGVPLPPLEASECRYDILLIGSLRSGAKGADLLLRAVARLGNELVPHGVAIAGAGRLLPELVRLRDRLGLAGRVHFLGNRSDIPDLLAESRLLAMPSRWEGLPMALLEAMAAAKPVVAARVGGIPEVISDGRNGRLVPPGNVDALAEAMRDLLTDADHAARLGRQARQDVQARFSIAAYSRQLQDLYDELLAAPTPALERS